MNIQRRLFERIVNPEFIDFGAIDKDLNEGKKVILQFDDRTKYNSDILSSINSLCKQHDKNLEIRFYGHYGDSFDCNILKQIPNVKALLVDCLMYADNVNEISKLESLQKLTLGIYNLKEVEILNSDNFTNISELFVLDTKSKAFNLKYLNRYKNLKHLIIAGHSKNIESVGEISDLETLSLNSVKKVGISFINRLKTLKTLKLILGGRENIKEIEENGIENLELVWVRGLNDLCNIGSFKKLKTLKIEDQIQLTELSFDKIMPLLQDVKIINCKTLNLINGVEKFPSLNTLTISRTNIDFEKFMKHDFPKGLKTFGFYTWKSKADKEIKTIIEAKGYFCR